MTESQMQAKVMQWIRKRFAFEHGFVYKASDRFIAGIPDIVGCYEGQMFGIELKVGRNKPTELQAITINNMRHAGAKVEVCYSLEEVQNFIEEIINESRRKARCREATSEPSTNADTVGHSRD